MNNSSSIYWESYYSKHKEGVKPSLFAQFVIPFLQEGSTIVDIGCGNGRDSIFFSSKDLKVHAVDQCKKQIAYLNSKYSDNENLSFYSEDMSELGDYGKIDFLYSRFSIHSINKEDENKAFDWAKKHLSSNGLFFIEVRSVNDDLCGQGTRISKYEYHTDHYRRFIKMEEILALSHEKGFRVIYKIESKGLAPYKNEDPAIIRLILQQV